MIVSSVFFWLEQIRYKAESYECNTLEQRRLLRAERAIPEETRWSCPLGFEGKADAVAPDGGCYLGESARWEREDDYAEPGSPDPPDNDDKAEFDPVTPVQCLEVEVMKEAKLSPVMRAKGKSLDSLVEQDVSDKVELRRKRHTLGGALPELLERRKGVFWGLETIDEDFKISGPYENIWECGSMPLKIHHGDISRTSVTFEETVEELETTDNVPIKYFANISEDMVQWLTDLIDSYSAEEDPEMESYSALPVRVYSPEVSRNVQPANRMTVGFIPSSRTNLEPKTFEKCTKISVDGKSTKIGKSETLKLEDNQLLISDEKGNNKVLVSDFGKFQEQTPRSAKELLYTHEKSVVKISKENTDVIERRTILQRLLGMRTPYSTLESRGIAKNEAVFGNTLENISTREKKNIPEFVTKITRLIEMPKNITSQGIYRASGNIATIQKIRWKVDLHKLNILDDHKDDTDVLAGTLKLFFRELKDCIIGIEQYNALNDILDKNGANGDLYMAVIDVVKTLSKPRRETLEHLMRHLLRVISYEKENSMSIQNMSICWGPSVICLEIGSTKDDIIALAQKKNSVVELLLRSYKYLFESQLRPSGSQLSLFDDHPSLHRLDSYEEVMPSRMKWSSMTALDNCLGEDFVIDIMRRIEVHKDANLAYKRMDGDKIAARIMTKAKKKTSKTLNRLLAKAKIEELCILLKFCYDDHFVSLLPQGKCNELQIIRDNLKQQSLDDDEIRVEMYKEIRLIMRKQHLFKQHVPLFAHFHKLIQLCTGDPISKLHEISNFWYKTICGTEYKGHNDILLIFDVIEAFKETDWIDLPETETESVFQEDTMRHSKTVGSALAHISEENLFDEEKAEMRSKCEDVIDCCTTKRPVTFSYTKASESDQD